MNPRNNIYFTAFCLLSILFTYIFIVKNKQLPSGDETISYLCATGNQAAYEEVVNRAGVYGKRVEAAEWRSYLQNHSGSLKHIAEDLTRTDLHPPLYFWLLHFFTLLPVEIFGSGLLLNAILHGLGLLVLMRVCRQLGLTAFVAWFVAIGWCFSPAISGVGFYARQYELLAVIHLLTISVFIAYLRSPKTTLLLFLLLFFALGMLTQYLFIYFSFAYTGYAALVKRNNPLVIKLLFVQLTAIALVVLIHPGIFHQFALQQQRSQSFAPAELVSRLGKTVLAFMQVFIPVLSLKPFLLALPKMITAIVLVVFTIGAGFWVARNRNLFRVGRIGPDGRFILWMLLCSAGLLIGPYFLFLTPFHAMGGQYLSLVYPFLLIAAGTLLSKNIKAMAAALSLMGVGYALQLLLFFQQQNGYKLLLEDVSQSEVIVVSSPNRRGFLRLVPSLQHQWVLLDEHAMPCDFPGKKTLYIAEEPIGNLPATSCSGIQKYDLQDGVVFYTTFTSSCSCAEPLSK